MPKPSSTGWFVPKENRIESPNFSSRSRKPRMIVLHTTIAPRETPNNRARIERWYKQKSTKSSHFTILRDGTILQGVSTEDQAWHAGESSWPRLGIASNVNAHAIGIDFDTLGRLTKKGDALFNAYGSPYEGDVISLGGKHFEPFTVEQIDSIRILLPTLLAHYTIDRRDIVGHCDVSPGRKTDPEAIFPWAIALSCLDGDPVTRRELAELVRYH